ncbi:hypothetical protein JRQ81_001550, partial [Phrynocephalus forsythii]
FQQADTHPDTEIGTLLQTTHAPKFILAIRFRGTNNVNTQCEGYVYLSSANVIYAIFRQQYHTALYTGQTEQPKHKRVSGQKSNISN